MRRLMNRAKYKSMGELADGGPVTQSMSPTVTVMMMVKTARGGTDNFFMKKTQWRSIKVIVVLVVLVCFMRCD